MTDDQLSNYTFLHSGQGKVKFGEWSSRESMGLCDLKPNEAQPNETCAQLTAISPELACNYLERCEGATGDNLVKVKELRGLYNNRWQNISELSVTTHAQPDIWQGIPSIGYGAENNFIIAYSRKNIVTNDMGFSIRRYYRSSASGWSSTLASFSMGVVDSDIQSVYPVVVSSSPQPFVVEDFVAWTDCSDGWTSENNPILFIIDLKVSKLISYKPEYEGY